MDVFVYIHLSLWIYFRFSVLSWVIIKSKRQPNTQIHFKCSLHLLCKTWLVNARSPHFSVIRSCRTWCFLTKCRKIHLNPMKFGIYYSIFIRLPLLSLEHWYICVAFHKCHFPRFIYVFSPFFQSTKSLCDWELSRLEILLSSWVLSLLKTKQPNRRKTTHIQKCINWHIQHDIAATTGCRQVVEKRMRWKEKCQLDTHA